MLVKQLVATPSGAMPELITGNLAHPSSGTAAIPWQPSASDTDSLGLSLTWLSMLVGPASMLVTTRAIRPTAQASQTQLDHEHCASAPPALPVLHWGQWVIWLRHVEDAARASHWLEQADLRHFAGGAVVHGGAGSVVGRFWPKPSGTVGIT